MHGAFHLYFVLSSAYVRCMNQNPDFFNEKKKCLIVFFSGVLTQVIQSLKGFGREEEKSNGMTIATATLN